MKIEGKGPHITPRDFTFGGGWRCRVLRWTGIEVHDRVVADSAHAIETWALIETIDTPAGYLLDVPIWRLRRLP